MRTTMLNGPQQLEWANTLVQAFDTDSFAALLLSLNDRVDLHAGERNALPTVVLAVIQSYNQQGITNDLLAAAVRMRPRTRQSRSLPEPREPSRSPPRQVCKASSATPTASSTSVSGWRKQSIFKTPFAASRFHWKPERPASAPVSSSPATRP